MKFNTLVFLLVFQLNAIASAAINETAISKGDLLICKNQAPVMLDWYYANLPTLSNPHPAAKIENMSTEEVIHFALNRMLGTGLGEYLKIRLSKLESPNNWIFKANLEDKYDTGEAFFNLPEDCHLESVAANIDGKMYIDPNLSKFLTASQLGVLWLHESIIDFMYSYYTRNQHEVSYVARDILRELLSEKFDLNKLRTVVKKYNFPFSYSDFGIPEIVNDQMIVRGKGRISVQPPQHLIKNGAYLGVSCEIKCGSDISNENLCFNETNWSSLHYFKNDVHDNDKLEIIPLGELKLVYTGLYQGYLQYKNQKWMFSK